MTCSLNLQEKTRFGQVASQGQGTSLPAVKLIPPGENTNLADVASQGHATSLPDGSDITCRIGQIIQEKPRFGQVAIQGQATSLPDFYF
jgi:hypothetical protein